METNEIINKKHPIKNNDGYEWSEIFDRFWIKIILNIYFNPIFVCENDDKTINLENKVKNIYKIFVKIYLL